MSHVSRRDLLRGAARSAAGLLAFPSLSAAVQTSSSPYRRPKLTISDVRTAEVMAHGYQLHVRIYTDQGPTATEKEPMPSRAACRSSRCSAASSWERTR